MRCVDRRGGYEHAVAPLRSLVSAALALTSGCSFIPGYHRPTAPVAASFPGGGGAGPSAASIPWREELRDPRLQRLVELALKNNRDLRVAALQVEIARAQIRVQGAAARPQLDLSASATLSHPAAATPYQLGANFSWELDLFGRVHSLKAAALETYLSQDETKRAAHLTLIGEVATQYLRERAYDEELALAQRTLEVVTRLEDMTQKLYTAGRSPELDVVTARGQVADARAEVARLERLRAQATNALVLLVGEPLPADLPPPLPLEGQSPIADLAPSIPSKVLLNRPDVLAAEHALRAANANIGAARAAFFPTIDLTRLLAGPIGWSVAPSLVAPLFSGGKNKANLQIATLNKWVEVAQYEKTIQTAFREVADALVARGQLDEQLAAQTDSQAAQTKRLDIATKLYRGGAETYLTVLGAQRDLYTAESNTIELRFERLTNLIDLYRALCGGSQADGSAAPGSTSTESTS